MKIEKSVVDYMQLPMPGSVLLSGWGVNGTAPLGYRN